MVSTDPWQNLPAKRRAKPKMRNPSVTGAVNQLPVSAPSILISISSWFSPAVICSRCNFHNSWFIGWRHQNFKNLRIFENAGDSKRMCYKNSRGKSFDEFRFIIFQVNRQGFVQFTEIYVSFFISEMSSTEFW